MMDFGDKARDDFLAELQEMIDTISRALLELDASARQGRADPDTINELFRTVHTLKGLAGLFSAPRMGSAAHELENLLDNLRMGRIELSAEVLSVLFQSVDLFTSLLAFEKTGASDKPAPSVESFALSVQKFVKKVADGGSVVAPYDLDPSLLSVLTEYEENRLRACVARGLNLFRIRVRFGLSSIDEELDALKTTLKASGEILTYLPTDSCADADTIELEILIAAEHDLAFMQKAMGETQACVEEMSRRQHVTQIPVEGTCAGDTGEFPAVVVQATNPADLLDQGSAQQIQTIPPSSITPARPIGSDIAASLRSVTQTVRVDIRRLDHLMNLVGEIGIVTTSLARLGDQVRHMPGQHELASNLARLHHALERHLGAMQTGILEVRMVPLGQVFDKIARVVRQASRTVGKEVNFIVTGAETEVDKLIVEELSDPLMHMVRNALDHGIESQSQRKILGKPAVGTIALNAFPMGSQVAVEIEDDGAGINTAALVASAIRVGAIRREDAADLEPDGAIGLLFLPGVTSRGGDVGKMSGRGVGMDVVKTNIGRLGGVVDVRSEFGTGTKFTITLPITLAIISALKIRVGDQTYAAPLSSVQEAVTFDPSEIRMLEGREIVTLRGETLPLFRFDTLFRLPFESVGRAASKRLLAMVSSAGTRRCGFVVDEIGGRQNVVIKPLTGPLRGAKGFAGATELGDQRVALVLDMPALIEEAFSGTSLGRFFGAHGIA